MKKNFTKQRGQYGTTETYQDELNSADCVENIYHYLVDNYPIEGYTYCLLNVISEELYYKRDCITIPDNYEARTIQPDSPTIILRDNTNPNNVYLVLVSEDKYQSTGGNAIERIAKNFNVINDKVCNNIDILPYVMFISGKSFILENGEYDQYFLAKFREFLPYYYNNKPSIWTPGLPHNSAKKIWNRVYFKRDRFSYDEKMNILMETAMQSVNYYKSIL